MFSCLVPAFLFAHARVFVGGTSDKTKPLVKSVRSSLPSVYPDLITRHDWPLKMFNWQIKLKGNSKLFSVNALGPLRTITRVLALLGRRH